MKKFRYIAVMLLSFVAVVACAPESNNHVVRHYLCNFEGAEWDALVDSDTNGNNLLNGFASSWHDEKSDLAGEVTVPYEGYWSGLALSNHFSTDCENDGQPDDQLYIYAGGAYSGKNALVCNCFFGGVELRFESKASYIESVMVANTTYLYNVAKNGNHLTTPLGKNESIWIEAKGYVNGSDEVQATTTFYLFKNGKPAFEGWTKWYMTSMCKADKIIFDIKWNGAGFNPYPAYFALDDIKVVRQEPKE
ncbi:MAG: DUF4465 domain-containing protein [Alistipes sp.]|nr:DUF4465 domain-containing protein [Alistipes sp.]